MAGAATAEALERFMRRDFLRAAVFQWIVPAWEALSIAEDAEPSSSPSFVASFAALASETARTARRMLFLISRLRRLRLSDCLFAFIAEG